MKRNPNSEQYFIVCWIFFCLFLFFASIVCSHVIFLFHPALRKRKIREQANNNIDFFFYSLESQGWNNRAFRIKRSSDWQTEPNKLRIVLFQTSLIIQTLTLPFWIIAQMKCHRFRRAKGAASNFRCEKLCTASFEAAVWWKV
jgi:hypothetical protein